MVSILPAGVEQVPELTQALVDGQGAPLGKRSRVECRTEAGPRRKKDGLHSDGRIEVRSGAHTAPGAAVYTDDAGAYEGLPFDHEMVKRSLSEYVKGDVHTNGLEPLWSMLKRAHKGIYHKMSPKHLDRYVQEFTGRHNLRDKDTLSQMGEAVRRFEGKNLTYADLKQSNGLPLGARA